MIEYSLIFSLTYFTKGDKGSALMCKITTGAWELQGLLSTSGDCRGISGHPAVFTKVQGMMEWIWATVGKKIDLAKSQDLQ